MMLVLRQQFGAICVEKDSAFRSILTCRKKNEKVVAGFIADQTPSVRNIHYWTTFLNQDTLLQTGMERIARQLGLAVVYLDIKKVERGHYVGNFSVITADLERGKQAVDEHWHEISDPVKLQEWRVQKFAYQYLLNLKQQYEDDLKTAKIELEKIQNPKREINKDYDNE